MKAIIDSKTVELFLVAANQGVSGRASQIAQAYFQQVLSNYLRENICRKCRKVFQPLHGGQLPEVWEGLRSWIDNAKNLVRKLQEKSRAELRDYLQEASRVLEKVWENPSKMKAF